MITVLCSAIYLIVVWHLRAQSFDVIVDVLQMVGWTCGSCKFQIMTLLHSRPAPSSAKEQEKKIDTLATEVKELKKQSKLVQQSGPEPGSRHSQSSAGSRDSPEGSV